MRVYTAHLRAHAEPVLVHEGFSWGAFFLGPLWLLGHGAWIAGLLDLCIWIAIVAATHGPGRAILIAALLVLQGVLGNDLRRWGLARRGYLLAHVVAARDGDTALARLLTLRPDLGGPLAG